LKTNFAIGAVLAALSSAAPAEDLLQVYRDAQKYDAVYSAARHNLDAGRERLVQGRSLVLPSLNLSGNASRQRIESESRDPAVVPSFTRDPNVLGYTLTFTQPLFRRQNWLQYDQAEFQVKQAEALFGQASQDLILRVAQAYFDVLAAQDTLGLVRAQKAAISEQLAQAKRNFEVGTATIVDTLEAQARYDQSVAKEIADRNDLERTTVPPDLLDAVSGDEQDAVAATGRRDKGRFAFDDKVIDLFVQIANRPRVLAGATVGVLGVGGTVYSFAEPATWTEGLWWAVVTGFTVGYGDFYPESVLGRLIGSLLIMSMFVLALCLGAQITSRLIEDRDEFTHGEQEAIKQTLARIEAHLTRPAGAPTDVSTDPSEPR